MNKENKFIIEFDFQLISDYFKQLDRQGPGSLEATKKALSFIENLPDDARIADIGCGSGGQTIMLADNTKGHIKALDLLPDFINSLISKIKYTGYENRIEAIQGSMENLPFAEKEFDLIWAEGSIYNIGFEKGLCEWRKYLKDNGYIAVTEVSWFTVERPAEIEEFWHGNYPGIDTIPNKIKIMEQAGYIPVAHFTLTEDCWLEYFFNPMPPIMEKFLEQHNYSEVAKQFIAMLKNEIELYKKYKEYYGYVFYIGRKNQ
ncbi:MAG: class I SAM-dependent methyltransferase [Dysgonomonas sp.]